jgi:NAD dependent epimerase/dehydratase family enzyme
VKVDEFYRLLRRVAGVWFFIKIPDICVRLMLGKASLILLTGQCVIPDKLIKSKYEFRDKDLPDILRNALNIG